jgi:uncharacterized protein (DUF1697 family)
MAVTYVALLRGINVGKAKRVAMADLRAVMESLGYGDVRTLLVSGNVVFTSRRALGSNAAATMQEALIASTGVSSRFFVLAAEELDGIVKGNPLAKRITEPSRGFVTFVRDGVGTVALRPMLKQAWGADVLALGERAAYTWCPDGMAQSPLMEAIGKAMRDDITVRNWGTTTKLSALASEGKRVRG